MEDAGEIVVENAARQAATEAAPASVTGPDWRLLGRLFTHFVLLAVAGPAAVMCTVFVSLKLAGYPEATFFTSLAVVFGLLLPTVVWNGLRIMNLTGGGSQGECMLRVAVGSSPLWATWLAKLMVDLCLRLMA